MITMTMIKQNFKNCMKLLFINIIFGINFTGRICKEYKVNIVYRMKSWLYYTIQKSGKKAAKKRQKSGKKFI